MARKREPRRAGEIIERIRAAYAIDDKALQYQAFKHWPEIVGEHVAEHTRPLYIVDKNLHVKCQGSVWSQELSFRKSEIISKINELMGFSAVKDIRYKVR